MAPATLTGTAGRGVTLAGRGVTWHVAPGRAARVAVVHERDGNEAALGNGDTLETATSPPLGTRANAPPPPMQGNELTAPRRDPTS